MNQVNQNKAIRAMLSRLRGLFPLLRSKDPSLKVLVVFIRHGNSKYTDAFERLIGYYQQCHPHVDHKIIIVDNALEPGSEALYSDCVLIGGRNTEWEFSAIDDAVKYEGDTILQYDFIHVVTSAFWRHYTDYIERITTSMLHRILKRDVFLGHIDSYDDEVFLLGKSANYWIRTSFFFLLPATVLRLGSFVSIPRSFAPVLFSGDPAKPFSREAPLSARLQQYVTNWLTGEGTGQGVVWHSRFDLNTDNLPLFEDKVLAILNENLLTRRLEKIGSAPIDSTYLHAIASKREPGSCEGIECDVPTQLKIRGEFFRANS